MPSSSFISDASPQANSNGELCGDSWFPCVSQSEFKELYRATGSVTINRQQHFLKLALVQVCSELSILKTKADSFYDLPHQFIGNELSTELDFKTAVYALAKSMLTEKYRDFDNTAKGHDRADSVDQSTDNYLRESREAIRRLLNKPRITVALV